MAAKTLVDSGYREENLTIVSLLSWIDGLDKIFAAFPKIKIIIE